MVLLSADLASAETGLSLADPGNASRTMSGTDRALPGIVAVPSGVKGLPYAPPDRVFSSLEEYLEDRRSAAAMGAPVIEAIGPDRFRETAGRSASRTSRDYTRAELRRRYGFD